jgi:hypothetical protein
MVNPDDFPTIAEFAAALRTSPRNVRQAISNGDIPAVKVSERVVRVNLPQFIGKSAGGAGAIADPPIPATPAPSASPSIPSRESS